jgi:hypothetical protein
LIELAQFSVYIYIYLWNENKFVTRLVLFHPAKLL